VRLPPARRPLQSVRSACAALLSLTLAQARLSGCGSEAGDEAEVAAEELLGEPRCRDLQIAEPQRRANVVVVLNDTMQRDVVGIYGGAARTPHFDRFARKHLLFTNAASQAPWTKPAIATLFTGLYPSQHDVASDPQVRNLEDEGRSGGLTEADVLSDAFVTLAEVLAEAGWRTAAFIANPWLEERFGFGQGFETYAADSARWGLPGARVVDDGLAWVEGLDQAEPFFLYLHFIDTHTPYGNLPSDDLEALRAELNQGPTPQPKEGLPIAQSIRLDTGELALQAGFQPTRRLIRHAYRRGVEEFDAILGDLLERLSHHPRWDDTAVIVTSDHGEALFARGYGNHGGGLYDDEAAIPLAARLPGVSPPTAAVECLAGLVDLMPTLCHYLGVRCPEDVAGWSLLAGQSDRPSDERRYLVTEGVMHKADNRSLRNRHFKLLYEPRGRRDGRRKPPYSLFDVADDPRERVDHLEPSQRSARADAAFQVLKDALPSSVPEYQAPEKQVAPVDPQLRERLGELGYLDESAD